jgi:hypothetical protein
VTIAWLAVRTAPPGSLGLFVGLAIAAHTLPGILGALTLGGILRGRPARTLVLAHCLLRAGARCLLCRRDGHQIVEDQPEGVHPQ